MEASSDSVSIKMQQGDRLGEDGEDPNQSHITTSESDDNSVSGKGNEGNQDDKFGNTDTTTTQSKKYNFFNFLKS